MTVEVQTRPVTPDETAWGDPPRVARGAGAPVLSVEGFEGPLDWLLEMVRAHRIDLTRLSILDLIEAFGSAFETALQARDRLSAASVARWSDWLVMAAALAELRSQLMLPKQQPDVRDAELQLEALRHQRLSRAHVAAAAEWLERRPQLGRDVFPRGRAEPGVAAPIRGGDRTALLRACLVALRVPEQAAAELSGALPFWRVQDAIARIQTLLGGLPSGGALRVFLPNIDAALPDRTLHSRAAFAGTLVASLELARLGDVELEQPEQWGLVHVQRAGTPAGRDGAGHAA